MAEERARDYSRFFQDEVKKKLPSQKVCVPFLPTPDRKSLTFRQIRIFPKLSLPSWIFLFALVLTGGWSP